MGRATDRNSEGRDNDYDEYREPRDRDGYDVMSGGGQVPDDGNAYWRRRFLILCGGVAALGVCAWIFPGPQQESARTAAAARASLAAAAARQELPSTAYGAAYPLAAPSPAVPTRPAATVKKPSTAYQPAPAPTVSAPAPTVPAPVPSGPGSAARSVGCAPGAVVLSLFTSQSAYPKGARPKFSVYAVSTSAAACTLAYGTGSVQVVVTRHGQVVWDSAACGAPAAKPVRFTLGVPRVLTMIWDPVAVAPAGCGGSLPAGGSGTFEAVAISNGQTSPLRAFTIGG